METMKVVIISNTPNKRIRFVYEEDTETIEAMTISNLTPATQLKTCQINKRIRFVHKEGTETMETMTINNSAPASQLEACPMQLFLPLDIVVLILQRLPARRVGRFRCVCKQWNSLTNDPNFISSHCKMAPHASILRICTKKQELEVYDLNDPRHRKNSVKVQPRTTFWSKDFAISNIVDGLAFSYGRAPKLGMCVLNPTTKEQLWLPKNSNCQRQRFFDERFGFGMDISTGEYKVVRIFNPALSDNYSIEILTVGTSQWRYLGEAPSPIDDSCRFSYCPRFVNGSLYWQADMIGSKEVTDAIISFSMREEKFESPLLFPGSPKTNFWDIIESDGVFQLAIFSHSWRYAEMWKLNDGMWIKLRRFLMSKVEFFRAYVIGIAYDIVFMASSGRSITYYDLRSKTFHKLGERESWKWMPIYRGSLISPKTLPRSVPRKF